MTTSDMTQEQFSRLSRRELFRLGGIGLISSSFLAACGSQKGLASDKAIASIGAVPPTTALPEAEITDAVLLRTAASLEYNAIDFYTSALNAGLFSGDFATAAQVARRFRADHQTHATVINSLVVALGSKAHGCANTRVNSLYIKPAFDLILAEGNPDVGLDAVTLAHSIENLSSQMYQGLVGVLSEPKLRGDAIHIGQGDVRHAVILAQILNPGLSGVGPSAEPTTGTSNVIAIPSVFGSLASLHASFGPPNADGVKTTITMETPSLNALVYEFVTC
ncbi:MAG: ferritin-like domain-containing protein [Ilumatobacteraceae bacterium]